MDKNRSEPSTALSSPAESDDEDNDADVDYDDVLPTYVPTCTTDQALGTRHN